MATAHLSDERLRQLVLYSCEADFFHVRDVVHALRINQGNFSTWKNGKCTGRYGPLSRVRGYVDSYFATHALPAPFAQRPRPVDAAPPPPPPPPVQAMTRIAAARERRYTMPVPRTRVTDAEIRYLYVARDTRLPPSRRELKVGISSDLAATLRTYHRRVPGDVFVLVVECAGAARPLERALLHEFDAMRVEGSEVLRVRTHEVIASLRRSGYSRGKDAIFRKQA